MIRKLGANMITRETCLHLDAADSLASYRDQFVVPEGMIYFDGNSLGPMPKATKQRLLKTLEQEWAQDLITSWNKHGWFQEPLKLGDRLARLMGGGAGNMVVADSISINLFKLLTAALALRPDQKVILSDTGNFPSDLYVAQGLNTFLNNSHSLKLVAPEDVMNAIDETVAVVMVTEIDYRTARRHDMKALIKKAHAKGALVIWDLSHSAGAIPVDLMGAGCDFAVGCTYKFLNAGPGAPAFMFVHPNHHDKISPALVGWWGDAHPFAFNLDYEPGPGITRYQVGTQPILSLAGLSTAMDIWDQVDMAQLDAKRNSLCTTLIACVEQRCAAFNLTPAGPHDMAERGSHVSFKTDNGYAIMQALIHHRVIGDFRAPDMIRFGLAPLYNTHAEVWDAVTVLHDILSHRKWDRPEFMTRKAVT
jgi:kynureninase